MTWTKPNLGLALWNGSRANNILWPLEPNNRSGGGLEGLFRDDRRGVPDSERWKMLCGVCEPACLKHGQGVCASPDGIHWRVVVSHAAISSDTYNMGQWDPVSQQYAFYMRHEPPPGGFVAGGPPDRRQIGLCLTPTLENICIGGKGNIVAMETDTEVEPAATDIYTNSVTRYEGHTLFFPSIFFHFNRTSNCEPHGCRGPPFNFDGDGLLDIRLAHGGRSIVARNITYSSAWNALEPFIPLQVNRCDFAGSVTDWGGWCSPTNGDLAKTTAGTSAVYMVAGYLLSANGETINLFASAQPFSHGGDGEKPTWSSNTAIQRYELRRDVSAAPPFASSSEASKKLLYLVLVGLCECWRRPRVPRTSRHAAFVRDGAAVGSDVPAARVPATARQRADVGCGLRGR